MHRDTWIQTHTTSLSGNTVVLTGATGGLGAELCRIVLSLGGRLILVARNPQKTEALRCRLLQEFPQARMEAIYADLFDMDQVRALCTRLQQEPIDHLVLAAGAYALPRARSSAGYDNIFQINFVSHYYMVKQLLPLLRRRKARVTAVGSIAHSFSASDPEDPDFSRQSGANRLYGNSKRYLMFALAELMNREPEVEFAIGHPGITPTGITSNYPKALQKLVKWPMKLTFMPPRLAVRSIAAAMFAQVPYLHWVGPRIFRIWGNPRVRPLTSCREEERRQIFSCAEEICRKLEETP